MLPEEVAQDLRRRIESGEFAPGAPLPTLAMLRREYAATDEPVRQALLMLAHQQVVTEVRGIGFVAGGLPDGDDDVIDDFTEARERLEEDLVALKAALADDAIMWRTVSRDGDVDFRATEATAVVELGAALPGSSALRQVAFTKTWSGGLVGTSEGVLLSVSDADEGEAEHHLSVELFRGSLDGRHGCLSFQRYRTARSGEPQLVCEVVPGSGSGQLAGVTGTMEVDVAGDVHRAKLVYRLSKPSGGV